MKKLGALVIGMAVVASTFTGCGGNTGTKTGKTQATPTETLAAPKANVANPEKPVTFKLSIWGSDAHKKMYDEMLAKYKEKNSNVTTEVMIIPFADYQQKISILKAGGQAPDIAWLADRMIPQFLENKQLVDVSSIAADKDYDFSDITPASLELLKKDGKNYGVAFSTPPDVIFYNKNLFKNKGLQTPMELYKAGKWNFEEFVKTAKALTDKDKGVYGVRLLNTSWKVWSDTIASLAWGFGKDIISDDKQKQNFNTPEVEKAVQMYYDLLFKDESHPKPGDQIMFDSGKIGMASYPISYVGTAKNVKDFEWDIAPWPKGPANGPSKMGYAAYVMFEGEVKSTDPAKMELYKYLTGKEAMGVTAQYFVPSRKSVFTSESFQKLYPMIPKESFQLSILDQMDKVKTLPSHKNWQKIDEQIQLHFDLLYTKTTTVKEVIKQIDEKVTPLMK